MDAMLSKQSRQKLKQSSLNSLNISKYDYGCKIDSFKDRKVGWVSWVTLGN